MKVDEALLQLKFKNNKVCFMDEYVVYSLPIQASLILSSVIEKAMERATKEYSIDDPSKMFVAEAFGIQNKIIKSQKRHAHEVWHKTRHRFIHVYVRFVLFLVNFMDVDFRLEEGEPPNYKGRKPMPNGWEKMDNYMEYIRSREMKPLL